ncbi:MAG: hypothetical protein ACFBRM_09765 [Pikeienuella sp.]
MPGSVKLWWHDGATLDIRHHPTPLINEPELAFETLSVDTAVAVESMPAPANAHLAVIESGDLALRYRVLGAGQSGAASDPEAKPLPATRFGIACIGVEPGARLSLLEG